MGRLILWAAFLVALTGVVSLAALPVGREATATVSAVIVAAALLFGRFAQRWWHTRMITIALFTFITLRYLFWRVDGTLPPPSDLVDFIPGVILFAAEMGVLAQYFVSLFVIIDPVRREMEPLVGSASEWPTVDVFIPSYNEEPELLETTLAAARAMDYPADRFRVFLLDDGGTDQKIDQADPAAAATARERRAALTRLCERLGCEYRTRPRNERAKAGNVNHTFQSTNGELVLILDADHVPTVDFLRNTVGFFQKDPCLFLVQTPHFFINPDPIEYNLRTFDKMPSENEMFYYSIQPGLDRWNASFFCGSAAVLRRAALDEVGGIVGDTITEDCETAIELHSRGWRSIYLARPMIAGLQPETFSSFITQRSRWGQGMIQLFLLKNPWTRHGLTLAQRLCYTNSMLYWFFWLWRPIFMLAPLCYAFFGLEICRVDLHDFLCFVMPHIFSSIFLAHLLHGRTRWPLFSELYEYLMTPHVARAAISTLLNPRAPTFKVTAKGEVLDKTRFSSLSGPFLLITLLLGAGLAACGWRYFHFPELREAILPVTIWNLLSFLLALAGLAVVYEKKRVRRQERIEADRPVELEFDDGKTLSATMVDVSAGGVGIRLPRDLRDRPTPGASAILRVPDPLDGSTLVVRVVTRRVENGVDGVALGVGFAPIDREQTMNAARLAFGDSAGWDAWIGRKRSNSPNLALGFVFFFSRALPRACVALVAVFGVALRGAARRLAGG